VVRILFILLLALPMNALSQNLVPNGSFECGEDFCSAFQTPEIAQFSKYACHWTCPTNGTSDIFSTLIPNNECYTHMPYFGVNYHQGTQLPRTGNRFAGIYSYSKGLGSDTISYREYLQVKLNKALTPGEKYCTEMYVSLAENVFYAANNLGIRFNVEETHVSTYTYLDFVPQILEKNIIKDTSQWVKIGAMFEPTESSQYLLIGSFYGDQSVSAETTSIINQRNLLSYYFIDDVSVEKLPYDQFTFGGQTVLCWGDKIELIASAGVDEVLWTTLEDTTTVVHEGEKFEGMANENMSFRVKSTGCHKTVIDTISIKVNPRPTIELGRDTALCKGSKLIIDAGDGHTSYQWQDQSTNKTFEVISAGIYWAEVSNDFDCKVRDEINVLVDDIPKIDLGVDTLLCDGFFPLRAGGNEYTYLWSTGSINSTYLPTETGTFWVEARNHCGIAKDTIALYSATDIFIPNVITANDDHVNDYLELGVNRRDGGIDTSLDLNSSLRVFNRWGTSVYGGHPYMNNWPASGDLIETGEYFYYLSVPGCKDFKGWIQVIR